MSKKQLKFSFRGVLLLIAVFLFVVFLFAAFFIYKNLKSVEQNVLNLREQMHSTNTKLQDFAQPKLNRTDIFKEMTKDWEAYQNEAFGFQLKHPVKWGKIIFEQFSGVTESASKNYLAFFPDIKDSGLAIKLIAYDSDDSIEKLATVDVKNALWQTNVGECKDVLFQKIKELKVGEIRNCFIRENIYGQRFLMYRYVQKKDDKVEENLIAVFPRDSYYLQVKLPDVYAEEIDYFLESIIFL